MCGLTNLLRIQYQRLNCSSHNQSNQSGFTLVELMIVVAIIGILTSIAVPSYTDYIKRGRAAEATSTLADLRVKMEQYFQDNRTYVGADLLVPGPCTPSVGSVQYFTYACANVTVNTYTISAAPAAGQGMTGFAFSVDQNNAKTSTFDGTVGVTCWLTKKSGTC